MMTIPKGSSDKVNLPSSHEVRAQPLVNPDGPIERECEDSLDRIDFARQLATLLTSQRHRPSITVGLEGEWGSGKTSCLNLVRSFIEKSGEAIVVQYSPWLVSTVDSLISGFFVQLATGIGQQTSATGRLQKVARQILKFGTLIQPAKLVPGVEPWGTVAETILESGGRIIAEQEYFAQWDVIRQKEKLESELNKLEKSVVVLIDDLDRLPPGQICDVIQLVKAIGGFRNVSYLLAYDRQVVCHAIGEVHRVDGERFMEKMISVAIPIPRLSQERKRRLLQASIEDVAKRFRIEFSTREREHFEWLFAGVGIHLLLDTPRDVHRLANRVACRLLAIKNELDLADLVGIELIALKFPQVAQFARRRWDEFVSVVHTDREVVPEGMEQVYLMEQMIRVPNVDPAGLDGDSSTTLYRDCIEIVGLGECTIIGRHAFTRLLEFLFPGMTGQRIDGQPNYMSAKRICGRNGMLLWLHGGMSPVTSEVADCLAFLNHPERRKVILDGWIMDGQVAQKLEFCVDELNNLTVQNREELCQLLLNSACQVKDSIVRFIRELLNSVGGEAGREPILRAIVSSSTGLDISRDVLMCVLTAAGIRDGGKFYERGEDIPAKNGQKLVLPRGKLYELSNAWLETVRRVARSGEFFEETNEPAGILCSWGQLSGNDFDEVRSFVTEKCGDRDWLRRFVQTLDPKSPLPDCVPLDFLDVLQKAGAKCSVCKGFLNSYDGGEVRYEIE